MDVASAINKEILDSFAFYSSLLMLKLLLMSAITGFYRIKNKAFANPEDSAVFKKVPRADPQVERVRRAHLNDLENIPAFCVLGYLYILTNPSTFMAILCYRVFAAARICHSIAYLNEIFPIRGLCFGIGFFVNLFMGVNVILYFL